MAGKRLRATSATTRSRSAVTVTSGANKSPPLGDFAISSMARAISSNPWISAMTGSTASAGCGVLEFLLEEAGRGIVRVVDQGDARDVRRNLFQEFQKLSNHGELEHRESGNVFSRSSVMNSRRLMCGWPPPGKRKCNVPHRSRLQSCVRPVHAARMDCWP